MTDPAEDIPPDRPLGQSDRDFELGTCGPGVAGAGGIGAVVQHANQLHRTLERMEATVPMVTDVHHPSAGRAITIEDVELPQSEVGILGPSVWHPADLHVALKSIDWADQPRGYTRRSRPSSPVADR